MSNVDEKLKRVIIRNMMMEVSVDDITENSNLVSDFGFDSMLIVKLLVEIEEEFNISIAGDDLTAPIMSNFNSLREYVSKKIA